MRPIILFVTVALSAHCLAQWSTDPSNPLVVCEAANNQWRMHALSDGGSGWYAFWTDMRTNAGHGSLYGQHFDAEGNALWTANGKLILDLADRSMNEAAPVRLANGNVMIAVLSSATSVYNSDTARAILVDTNGDLLWAQPALLSVNGPGIFGNCFSFSAPQGIRSGDGAYFCYHGDSQGSNGYYVMQRVNADGTVAFTVPGIAVPFNAGFGPHEILPDGADGMYVAWRCSNGSGTCLRAVRVNSSGAAVWSNYLDVSANGPGLAYSFTTMRDGTGALINAWEQVGGDIAMARYDNASNMLWTPSPFFACNESHGQALPAMVMSDGALFVAWGDNRPPANNQDLYIQKFDLATGAPQWTADGVQTIHTNSYIPTPRIVPSANGGVIGIMDMSGPEKYCAMRLNADGTQAWPQPSSFATSNVPFYENRTELADSDGGVVSFWMSDNYDLYAAKIYPNGDVGNHVGIHGIATTDHFQMFPNPANDALSVRIDGAGSITAVDVIANDGRVVLQERGRSASSLVVPLNELVPGLYSLRVTSSEGMGTARFVKQ